MNDKLLTLRDVAEILRVHEWTVRRMVGRGDLPVIRLNTRGDMRFHRKDVEDFIERRTDMVLPAK